MLPNKIVWIKKTIRPFYNIISHLFAIKGNSEDESAEEVVSIKKQSTDESAAYRRRLTIVTPEEPIPSDVDDEQPNDDGILPTFTLRA